MLPAERAGMGAGGDRPHDPPARLPRQARIQRRTDQLVAEQRHLLRPLPTGDVVLLGCAHHEHRESAREGPAGTGRAATLARIPGNRAVRQGQLVLRSLPGSCGGQPGARSRPAEHATATCQAVTGPSTPRRPKRSVTATVAAPNAASTSRHGEPIDFGTGRSTPARRATCIKCSRVASRREPITRSQPRTVAAGTRSVRPILRCPAPSARDSSAAPITSAAYARRTSTVTGSSTCVIWHAPQRARRGRITPATPAHHTRARPPPRVQRPRAVRADDLPEHQPGFDSNLVSLYRHQRVPPRIQHGPPATVLHDMQREGRSHLVASILQQARHSDGADHKDRHTAQGLTRHRQPQRRTPIPTSSSRTTLNTRLARIAAGRRTPRRAAARAETVSGAAPPGTAAP